jgi:uncharacterized membrane protein
VQLAEEAYGNIGYIQGLWTYRRLVPEPVQAAAEAEAEAIAEAEAEAPESVAPVEPEPLREDPGSRYPLAVPAGGLALLAGLTPLHDSWAVQFLMVPLLLVVPGVILLRALRVTGKAVVTHPVYVPAASVLVLLCSGLAIDLLGPHVGIAAPLRTAPLSIALEVVCLALLACSLGAPPETQIPWSSLSRPVRLAWPLLIPLLSAAGALRLNSGHSGNVAVFAVVVVLLAAIAGFLVAPRCDDSLLMVGVFALGLAMMWSFSLRGDLVYGFDISSEWYSLQQTVTSGIWHVGHANDAYGAMLSVTVLPAELHALSGIPALLVVKVVYPVIGALFLVAVFNLARRVLTGRWAFMAAALVLMQSALFQQMPALTRQEVATLLFAALILAVLDSAQSQRTRWTFVCLLSLGMVVSHYSTAYLAITLLAIAIVFQWAASWFGRVPHVTGAVLLACAVSVAGVTVWYGALTHSTSNLSQFVQTAEGQGINLLPHQGGNLLSTYLQGQANQQLSPAQYESSLAQTFRQRGDFIKPLPDASDPRYALQSAPSQVPPVTSQLGSSAVNRADLLIEQALNVLAGVSALTLALQRKAPVLVRQIGLLGLAGMVILVLVRISGTLAQEYNPSRAFFQMMIVLAIGICWLFQQTGERFKRTRPAILAIGALSFALFFAGSSGVAGVAGVAFGGGTPASLADGGDDYQQFVKTTPDLAAASWVSKAAPADQPLYADNYAKLLLNTTARDRQGVFDAITPETLDQHAWVYATSSNSLNGIVRSLSGDKFAAYAFPSAFLSSNYNLVYVNGSAEVFHR